MEHAPMGLKTIARTLGLHLCQNTIEHRRFPGVNEAVLGCQIRDGFWQGRWIGNIQRHQSILGDIPPGGLPEPVIDQVLLQSVQQEGTKPAFRWVGPLDELAIEYDLVEETLG